MTQNTETKQPSWGDRPWVPHARHFGDLRFEQESELPWPHRQAVTTFANGYGASVIQGRTTYGGPEGLYELAVIRWTEDGFDLVYDTPITNDVKGHLSEEDVTRLLGEIAELPAVPS